MSRGGYKIRNQQGLHFITFAVVEWVDVFTRSMYCDIVVKSLKYCQKEKGLRIFAWVIMSNHVHFIFATNEGNNLSNVLRDFKKFTSVHIIRAIKNNYRESRRNWMLKIFRNAGNKNIRNSSYQFWRQENRPIELRSNSMIDQRLNYLHNNPVAAGMVSRQEHYLYSSARNYYGLKGLIEVEIL